MESFSEQVENKRGCCKPKGETGFIVKLAVLGKPKQLLIIQRYQYISECILDVLFDYDTIAACCEDRFIYFYDFDIFDRACGFWDMRIDRGALWIGEVVNSAVAAIPLWYQPKGGRDEQEGGIP